MTTKKKKKRRKKTRTLPAIRKSRKKTRTLPAIRKRRKKTRTLPAIRTTLSLPHESCVRLASLMKELQIGKSAVVSQAIARMYFEEPLVNGK